MTDTDLLAIDEASRLRALEPASFVVEAPAGAGKTELLTQRYLCLLASVDEPEEIVAITFTNKAAAEMRARIQDSLAGAVAASHEPSSSRGPQGRGDPAVEASWIASSRAAPRNDEALPPHKQITRDLALGALARDAERGWGLSHNPARMRITTIDALGASLARQMPYLSRFGAQPAVCDNPGEHYETATRRTLALLEEGGDAADTVAEALRYFSNETAKLQRLVVSMLARRDQWLPHLHGIEQREGTAIAALIVADLSRAAALLDAGMQSAIMPAARYAAGNLVATGSDSPITMLADWTEPLIPPELLADLPMWRGVAALLLTNGGTLRCRLDKNMGLPAEKEAKPFKEAVAACCAALAQTAGAEAALARIRQLPAPQLDAEEARIVGVFARLLKLASAQLWLVFQQRREVDFIEVAQRALSALGEAEEPSRLQLKLDYRISHLLVDEFQDTSPTQIALLTRLTAGWQPGDGRTLFVVGDPMQSIYRFRKADVGLFLQARDAGIGAIGLEALRLTRNNRSHREVVDWINGTFPAVFPAADNPQTGAVRFTRSFATKPSLDGAGVFIHPVLASEENDTADIDEARATIDILRHMRAQDPRGSIAILVRARQHLDALVTEMRRSAPELRYQAMEIEALEGRQVVQDLLALTRALHHRADRVNWLAILRAPWCGLLLADLFALAGDDHDGTVWTLMHDAARLERLSHDGRERLLHVRAVLGEAFTQQGRQRTRRWVEAAWRMLGGEACLHGSADAADAQAYFGLLDKLDAGGGFALERLEREIVRLYAAPDPLAEGAGSPAIQIMTVHKSKGLEFDNIILPGLHRATRNGDNSLLLWEEFADGHGHEHLVIAPVKPRRNGNDRPPSAYDYLRILDAEREANESSRVLYVAATRAIRALHLVAVAAVEAKEEGDRIKPPKKGSPLASLWPAVEADFTAALENVRHSRHPHPRPLSTDVERGGRQFPSPFGAEQGFRAACRTPAQPAGCAKRAVGRGARDRDEGANRSEDNALVDFIPQLVRLASPAIAGYWGTEVVAAPESAGAPDDENDAPEEGDCARLADIGTLAHRSLELIAQDGLDQWSVERVEASLPAFKRWLQGKGHAQSVLEDAATQVKEAVCKAIASETGRWILAKRESADNELALTGSRDGRVVSNVIDRTFVENGERWIIDYKTARFESDASESDLVARAEVYRPQLERYAVLFAEEGLPIRTAIFFVMRGTLVLLEPEKPEGMAGSGIR